MHSITYTASSICFSFSVITSLFSAFPDVSSCSPFIGPKLCALSVCSILFIVCFSSCMFRCFRVKTYYCRFAFNSRFLSVSFCHYSVDVDFFFVLFLFIFHSTCYCFWFLFFIYLFIFFCFFLFVCSILSEFLKFLYFHFHCCIICH